MDSLLFHLKTLYKGDKRMKMNWKSKKTWIFISLVAIILVLSFNHFIQASKSNKEVKRLERKIDNRQETIQKKDAQISKLEDIVAEAEPWFDLTEKEQQRKIDKEEQKKAKAKEKEKKEKEAAEAKAERKAKEEEKKGYEAGITYDQLARNPDDYIGEKVQFQGKVVQVMDGDGTQQIRFAVDDDYDNMMYAEYDSDIVDSRILEGDMITIMAISNGLLTYESTMGGNITIPSVLIDKIEQ